MRRFLGVVRRRVIRLAFLPPVLFWMIAVEATVRSVPLPKLSRILGVPLDSTTEHPAVNSPPPTLSRWQSGQLGTLRPVAACWPFADGPCLRQSLVAGHILRRHHPVLRLGVAPREDGFQAHAWVEIAGHLMGESDEYTPLINVTPPAT